MTPALRTRAIAGVDLETRLWRRLRRHGPGRPIFHRDYPVGPIILALYCPSANLAVEIDRGRGLRNRARDRWLAAQGLALLRIPASRVLEEPDAAADGALQCARELRRALNAAPAGPQVRRTAGRRLDAAAIKSLLN